MKIYTIVVFPNEAEPFSASIHHSNKMEVHEKFIRERSHLLNSLGKEPIYDNYLDSFFYAIKTSQRSFVFAVDEELDKIVQSELYFRINIANNAEDLRKLIDHPEMIGKIQKTLQSLDELKGIVLDDVDKLIQRHIQLEELQPKSEITLKESKLFQEKAVKLKERYRCSNFLFFFGLAKNLIWGRSSEPKPTLKIT